MKVLISFLLFSSILSAQNHLTGGCLDAQDDLRISTTLYPTRVLDVLCVQESEPLVRFALFCVILQIVYYFWWHGRHGGVVGGVVGGVGGSGGVHTLISLLLADGKRQANWAGIAAGITTCYIAKTMPTKCSRFITTYIRVDPATLAGAGLSRPLAVLERDLQV